MSNFLTFAFSNAVNGLKTNQNPDLISETLALVGPAYKGPAFVPTSLISYDKTYGNDVLNTFENIFGTEDQNYSPAASTANIWFSSGSPQLSYTRVLGIGDGQSIYGEGIYSGSGFVVGEKNSRDSVTKFKIDNNKNAQTSGLGESETLKNGRTFFYLRKYKNEISNDLLFHYSNEADQYGIFNSDEYFFVIDRVYMTSQGVYLTLNPSGAENKSITLTHHRVNDFQDYSNDINDNLRSLTVKSDTTFGRSNGDLIGSYVGYNTHKPGRTKQIYINGLNNQEYSTKINNYIQLYDSQASSIKNYYNDEVGSTEDYINKHFKRLNDRGYIEYCSFTPVNENVLNPKPKVSNHVFTVLCTSKLSHNQTSVEENIPSYEDFQAIYKKAKTPWVTSQSIFDWENNFERKDIDKKCKNLFRFHSCDDGEIGNRFRIRIKPKKIGIDFGLPDMDNIWSTFDVDIHEYDHKTNNFTLLMTASNIDLNPDSVNYICRVFGTENTYYDIENKKIVTEGFYRQTNEYLFVEVDESVEEKLNSCTLMPAGFHSYPHINIKSSNLNFTSLSNLNLTSYNYAITDIFSGDFYKTIQKPVDYVSNFKYFKDGGRYSTGKIDVIEDEDLYWGVQFNNKQVSGLWKNVPESVVRQYSDFTNRVGFNISIHNIKYNNYKQSDEEVPEEISPYYDYTKFWQNSRSDINVWVEDKNYLNGFFSLEKILYIPYAVNTIDKYRFATYRRDGKSIDEIKDDYSIRIRNSLSHFMYVNLNEILNSENPDEHCKYLKFDFFTYGGFDGTNCFDYDKKLMNNNAMVRELEDESSSNFHGGPTYNMYKTAMNIASQYENTDADILSIPDIRHIRFLKDIKEITDSKDRFISIIDVPILDESYNYIIDPVYKESYINNENRFITSDNTLAASIAGDLIEIKIDTGVLDDSTGSNVFKTIRTLQEEGSVASMNYFNNYNLESKNICCVYNDLIVNILDRTNNNKYKDDMTLPGSSFVINGLANSYDSPQSNIDRSEVFFSNNKFEYKDVTNINFTIDSNIKRRLLKDSIEMGINVIGSDLPSSFKLNSFNSLFENRESLFRTINNKRVMNRIKKELMFTLYGYNSVDLLFVNNSAIFDINSAIRTTASEVLDRFVEENIINNFKVTFSNNSALDYDSYHSAGSRILISLYGKSGNNLTNISLDDIMSNMNSLIENFNEKIIVVRS